jgi:hypothetical protein
VKKKSDGHTHESKKDTRECKKVLVSVKRHSVV